MTNKMTYTNALEFVMTTYDLPTDVSDKLSALVAQLEKRSNSATRKPTAKQTENASLKETIQQSLANHGSPATITELLENYGDFEGVSNQRLTALMSQLVREGVVTRGKEGRKSVFSLA